MTNILIVKEALEKLSNEELEQLLRISPRPLRNTIRSILYKRTRHHEKPLALDYDIISVENGVATIVTSNGKILCIPVDQLKQYDFIINT